MDGRGVAADQRALHLGVAGASEVDGGGLESLLGSVGHG